VELRNFEISDKSSAKMAVPQPFILRVLIAQK
jgi:hypothetical protein